MLSRARALAAALALLSACVGDPGQHLDRARELAFQRQPAEAMREYEEVLSLLAKKDPQKTRALYLPALKGAGDLCYLELKRPGRAIELYRRLTHHFPEAPETLDARANLADLFRSQGDRRAAVAELAAIIQAFPDSPELDRFQYQAVKDYFDLKDYDQVQVEARLLESRWPQSGYAAEAQMLVAATLFLQGQKERAIEAFEQVAHRWPASDLAPRARFEEAKILAELGKEEKAVDLLVEVLRSHPDPRGVQAEIARLRKRLAIRRVPAEADRALVWPEFYGGGPRDSSGF
jgi:TolA-binding protein